MADILNEITDGLNELIKETDEKYDKFLFEDDSPRILQIIDAYEKAGQEANQAAFDAPSADGSNWNGTFGNAMSPRAGVEYQEYMKNQPKIEDQNTKAKELQDKAQVLADEIRKEYAWIVKSTRGKGLKRYASLDDMIKYFKQKYSQQSIQETEQPLNENVYKVYHGTNQQFSKFDFKRATQGIVWFTDSPESIQKGEHGGAGNKIIMTRYITINKPAGWAEYEKYGLQQLEDMGYDGVILPQENKTDYFVFSPKSISAKGPKELGEANDLEDNTWAIFKIVGGKKSFVTSVENNDFIHVTDYAVKYSDPSVLKFPMEKAKEIISRNMDYDEKFGIVNSKGLQKIFVKKGSTYTDKLRFDSSNELNEIGEANTQPYEFDRVDYPKEYIYKFTTEDGDNYIVNVMQMRDSWIIDYRLADVDATFLDVVNKGRVYRVMATLYKILQDFVKIADPQVIRFEPTKDKEGDDRRYKLYSAFIKKNLPYNYRMEYKEPYGFTLTKKQSLTRD